MAKALKLDVYRKALQDLQNRLDKRAASLRDEALRGAGGVNVGELSASPTHLADLANNEVEAVVNLGLAENDASMRRDVEDALARIDEGTYGICERCHRKIDPERLEAIPYSHYCIHCARRKE